jgi:hypothetical protein
LYNPVLTSFAGVASSNASGEDFNQSLVMILVLSLGLPTEVFAQLTESCNPNGTKSEDQHSPDDDMRRQRDVSRVDIGTIWTKNLGWICPEGKEDVRDSQCEKDVFSN